MNRSLVDRALEKAAYYEKKGDKERSDHFMELAERAEKAYDNIDKKRRA